MENPRFRTTLMRIMTEKKDKYAEDNLYLQAWMPVYGVLVTIILLLFIMLASISVIDENKYLELKKSVRSAFLNIDPQIEYDTKAIDKNALQNKDSNNSDKPDENSSEGVGSSNAGSNENNSNKKSSDEIRNYSDEENNRLKFKKISESVQTAIYQLGISKTAHIVEDNEKLILHIDNRYLFEDKGYKLKETAHDALRRFAFIIGPFSESIEIKSYINDESSHSNDGGWELTSRRAINIAGYFSGKCGISPEKLEATGYGIFRPLVPQTSEKNRLTNDRTEIVLNKN